LQERDAVADGLAWPLGRVRLVGFNEQLRLEEEVENERLTVPE